MNHVLISIWQFERARKPDPELVQQTDRWVGQLRQKGVLRNWGWENFSGGAGAMAFLSCPILSHAIDLAQTCPLNRHYQARLFEWKLGEQFQPVSAGQAPDSNQESR